MYLFLVVLPFLEYRRFWNISLEQTFLRLVLSSNWQRCLVGRQTVFFRTTRNVYAVKCFAGGGIDRRHFFAIPRCLPP